MLVPVAVIAARVRQPDILNGAIGGGLVAFLTGNFVMCSRTPESCLVVLKARRILPLAVRMAFQTVFLELSAVLIRVAAQTLPPKPQERTFQVLDLDLAGIGCRKVFGVVTPVAGESGMLALQRVPRFAVIEGRWCRILHQSRVRSLVFNMTTLAFAGGDGAVHYGSVKPTARPQSRGNFLVAVETGKLILCRLVAVGAMCEAAELSVCPRERSGRNLPPERRATARQQQHRNDPEFPPNSLRSHA